MHANARNSAGRSMAVLHPAFALTGVLHAIGGPLLPSLAATFHLNDSRSGLLFLLYFGGTSLGALFCRVKYARNMALGFLAISVCCLGIAAATEPFLPPVFFMLGVSVGVPMSCVSLFVGRAFPDRCAPILTFLNFSWSVGALVAPLLAAQILMHHSYRAAYLLLALAGAVAASACGLLLEDAPDFVHPVSDPRNFTHLRLIVVFALAAFLQVGIENTAIAWLPTYALRMEGSGLVMAAASSSLYWIGFLASRGLSSLLLLRAEPVRVFRIAVVVALTAGVLLAAWPSAVGRSVAMFLLGAALAPIYPLVIAGSIARAQHISDSRWVLATAGFGGSVLPWLAGWISGHTGSLRLGILTIPAALLLMVLVLPAFQDRPLASGAE
jgi:FHS family glucose/mannose:H+ symporter-like MFS transporter